jgi:hypothetical protein
MPGRQEQRWAVSVPAGTRWFVRAFLVAVFLCAALRLEAWPLTGFRLFSTLRTETQITWVADTVSPDGTQTRLWFSELARPYQGFYLVMRGFRKLPTGEQRAMCAAWIAEARRVRDHVSKLRIYRVERQALPRSGDRGVGPETKVLEYACS